MLFKTANKTPIFIQIFDVVTFGNITVRKIDNKYKLGYEIIFKNGYILEIFPEQKSIDFSTTNKMHNDFSDYEVYKLITEDIENLAKLINHKEFIDAKNQK